MVSAFWIAHWSLVLCPLSFVISFFAGSRPGYSEPRLFAPRTNDKEPGTKDDLAAGRRRRHRVRLPPRPAADTAARRDLAARLGRTDAAARRAAAGRVRAGG